MVQQLGLDQPALTRYWQWITGLLHGDMGDTSIAHGSPVAELVWGNAFAVTVPLAVIAAYCITAVLAIAMEACNRQP